MPHSSPKIRLAYVVSHPIQYQAPLLRRIAQEPDIDLTVLFCSDFSTRAYQDEGFGTSFQWDVSLTDGYKHEYLPRIRDTESPSATRPINFGFLRRLMRGADTGPFDAVWIHGYASVNALHTMLAAKALGLPVLIRADIWLGDRPRSQKTLFLKRLFFEALRHLVTGVLAIGTHNIAYWREYFGPEFPIFLLPYAVDNDFFRNRTLEAAPQREELRTSLQMEPGRPIILFASKLQTRKHCDHLLEAYLALREPGQQDPSPYLLIVGDGEERNALEAMVQQSGCTSVRFAGFRNQTELPRFFDLSDIFVLPSRHEPWGLIVNEAMNASLPVVVTDDVGAAVDLIEDGVTGFTYPVGNVQALHQVLQRALSNPQQLKQIAEQALHRIQQWDFEADIRGLKTALRAVTGMI